MDSEFEAVIGLEVHAQLATDSKLFAYSSTVAGKRPNTQTDPVTLGLPGCLPVLNKRAVDFAIRLGLGTSCEITEKQSKGFANKTAICLAFPKPIANPMTQLDKICDALKKLLALDTQLASYIHITRLH